MTNDHPTAPPELGAIVYLRAIPRDPIPAGRIVAHNHVRPADFHSRYPLGWHGFRAWTDDARRRAIRTLHLQIGPHSPRRTPPGAASGRGPLMSVEAVVHQVEDEVAALDAALAQCDWRFHMASAIEHRRNAVRWVLDLLRDEVAA